MNKKNISLIISFVAIYFSIQFTRVYAAIPQDQDSKVKTIKINKTGNELSEPIIELGGSETITLTFDDLSDSPMNYSYTLVHCSSNWNESKIIKSDYMEGFETNPINDYKNSYSTTIPYTHYKLIIPNSDVKIKLSGNYIIRVFDTYNPEKIILEQRFMVVEPILKIDAKFRQPIGSEVKLTSQQIDLTVATELLSISNPHNDLVIVVLQNGQLSNSFYGLKPVFIRSNEIVYSSPNNLIFNGINEFRFFDINSIRYISSGIQKIDQVGGEYNILLQPSENNRKQLYSALNDINGRYKINLENSELSDIEADYVWVYFTLPYYDQLPEKEVYVYGELSNWQFAPQNLMNYNLQRAAYELRMQLKQGYYNYRYVVRDTRTGEIDETFFEGSHFETENNYLILVYYKQVGVRYERLIGIKRLNSKFTN